MVAKLLIGHVRPVTSVSWSSSGRRLLTSGLDWNLRIWEVGSSNFLFTKTFDSMILHSQLHPSDKEFSLVSPWMDEPYIVNINTGKITSLQFLPSREDYQKRAARHDTNCIAYFNLSGDCIFLGSHEGVISVLDTITLKKLKTIVIGTGYCIKSFSFSKDEKQFLVNSADKVIRLYNIDGALCHELIDAINKVQWKICHFAGDDYIVGASSDKQEHKIFIWSRESGQLHKILEGPNSEVIIDIAWHPTRPIIVSCTALGSIFVWSRQHTDTWSAFAPGFTELEENEEYIEAEDEFDVVDEQETKKKEQEEVNEEWIDITTPEIEDEIILPTHPIPDTFMVPQSIVSPLSKKQAKKRKIQALPPRTTQTKAKPTKRTRKKE
eukprot:TRINITY_DN14429_c0_g1_i1.p1 TRINITY_DN14429_c0_g1~~TRINITY_DN14429_c0_g1_i1.p1  ORF type:complete len:435 (-),score=121.28 TRINITY_DN14429_c0_g1_i1:8-1147(-)